MSAIMVSRITIRDQAKFQDYLEKTQILAGRYGAELVARGTNHRVLTGNDDTPLIVIVKFPSVDRLNDWFDSPDYAELVDLREEGAEMHMTSYQLAG